MTYNFHLDRGLNNLEPQIIVTGLEGTVAGRRIYKEWDYCPVLLYFEAAVLTASRERTSNTRYRLKIKSPTSNRRGVRQSIADDYLIEVPLGEPLLINMVPSARYIPTGHYEVEYYREGQSVPFDLQRWLVPERPPLLQYAFDYDGRNNVVMPIDAYSIHSIDPHYDFLYDYNSLMWQSLPPPVNQPLVVTYQPAATLADILIRHEPVSDTIV